MKSLISSVQSVSFLIVTFFILVYLSSFDASQYATCGNVFNCGRLTGIDYPFYGGDRPLDCGYPGFELDCDDGVATMEIMGVEYLVLDINQESQTLSIAREDLTEDICQDDNFLSSTLDYRLFEHSSNDYLNVTILYGCPEIPGELDGFFCDVDETSKSNAYIVRGVEGPGNCLASVVVPVRNSSFQGTADFWGLLAQGFEIRTKVDTTVCNVCKNSNGRCGFNRTSAKFTCLCEDQTSASDMCIRWRDAENEEQFQVPGYVGNETWDSWSDGPTSTPETDADTESDSDFSQFSRFLFAFVICLIIHAQLSACQSNDRYESCGETFQCGQLQDVGYPFSGRDRPEYCGYPGFELTCDSDVPHITIESINYRVLNVSSDNFTVAREDLWNNPCPTQFDNATLDFNLFNYTQYNQNFTIFYGCSFLGQMPNQFRCNALSSFFISSGSSLSDSVTCASSIIVPVTLDAAVSLMMPTADEIALSSALTSGFGLQWFANNSNCLQCVESNGRCGYDSSADSFECLCSDGQSYPLTCRGGRNRSRAPLAVGLSVAGAVVAGIGIGLCFLCTRRKRRIAAKASVSNDTESGDLKTISSSNPLISPFSNVYAKSIPSYPAPKSDIGRGSTYFGVQVFDYKDLQAATDNFNSARELGDGGYGAVYHGNLLDGRVVAVKRLYENNFKRVEQFMNEVELLARLRHQNLVQLFGCTSKSSPDLLLVYEYIPNGTVADHLQGKRANSGLLSWPVRLKIAVETADALAYLHSSEIIHRDVKTTNILLDNDFNVKVGDFGLSRLFPTNVTHVSTAPQGTPGYVDPEYYQVYQLTEKSDVYSFGVVLAELISSLEAVDTNRHRHDINLANMAVNKIQSRALDELVDQTLGYSTNSSVRSMITAVAELAFRCLQQERDMRPSMKEVLEFLRDVQNQELDMHNGEAVEIIVEDVALKRFNDPPSPISVLSNKEHDSSTSTSTSTLRSM